ncbi:MAG: tRNA (guanosine(46)-N7)-methyltransferase TrmB [Calditrichia bacterium]
MKKAEALQFYLNPRRSDHFPLNWEKEFGRSAPLGLEIGCGNGEYLAAWAAARPEWNLVGIELAFASIDRITKRLLKLENPSARVLLMDARFAVRELFPDNSLDYIIMNFPDPWPKEKHKQRRLLDPDFIKTLSVVLKPGAVYELVTDQEWYARDAAEFFRNSNLFEVKEIELDPRRPVTTKYERKWLAEGRHTYRLLAVKKEAAAVQRILEEGEMPHFIIQKPPEESSLKKLKGLVFKDAEKVVTIKDVYLEPENGTALLRTVAADKDYSQNFFMLVAPHEAGSIVKLDQTMQPFRTPAVKMAVKVVGEFLKEN